MKRYGRNAKMKPATKAAPLLRVSERTRRNIVAPDSANDESSMML